jgi:glucokinase
MKEVALGIDIGGTNTVFGFIDRAGNTLAESSIATKGHSDVNSFLKALNEKIQATVNGITSSIKLMGIGIGAPNGNYYKGTIENAPNLAWGRMVQLVDLMKLYYDVPIVLTNDANAAAIGEKIYGGAKNMNDFIVITLGTGLGSGVFANGNILYGYDGFAGELGHVTVNYNGRHCGCGRKGCLETYVSATGIKRTVYKLLADYMDPSVLRGISFDDLSAEMITKAAKEGDKIGKAAFEYTGRILGMKLADFVTFSSPEAIFLFGGLARAEEHIFVPTKENMEKNLMAIFQNRVKILPSELMDRNAAILGASALLWMEIEKK